ncbi:NAD-dependent epimerase/dehydratase family protein [Haloferula sargassicola]|uniref:N-acetyl-alpha-D-glucosaminyl-diphospho-ditrans, octacis-undecaprenol 4-epimerase n=1 Tax=Haloferula sargassicola TaxID=490096 RepID=A0ABP9UQ32_9BACT
MKKVFVTGGSGFIGTNLVQELRSRGCEVLNFDIQAPLEPRHQPYWRKGDILQREDLREVMEAFSPDWVMHLAGRAECDENTTVEEGYQANTDGVANLLHALEGAPPERLLMVSSQYVCGPGRQPDHDQDYFPATVYGQSKVITEQLTRNARLACAWTIVRPVNIWGPYHIRYSREFWKIAAMGLYVHPDVPAPVRTYGYVGNVVWQMLGLLEAPAPAVDRGVFYVGDHPIRIDQWSLGFARALSGRNPPRVPLVAMKGIAKAGDAISRVTGKPFFLTSSRLQSMTIDYLSPIDATEALLGPAPWSLEEGIQETVAWFRARGKKEKA